MKWFVLFFLIFVGFLYFFPSYIPPLSPPQPLKEHHRLKETQHEGIISLIGKTEEEVKEQYGLPARMDDSAYDYKWWIYNQKPETYLQLGMLNGRVVTAFICGEQIDTAPFQIGQPIQELFERIPLSSTLEVSMRNGTYRFELSEQDVTVQPLVSWNHVYVQLYIDHFTGKISSIRLMDGETLVKLRPYELVYRGALPSPRPLSPQEQQRVEQANAKQIFEITNVMRKRYNVPLLKWHEKAAQTAYAHSLDMKKNGYFSHHSPVHGNLKDRLSKARVPFQIAGENIAAQHIDAIAAVEGWLNSKSHRNTMLSAQFTHLGVGVSGRYYTQHFLKPWELPHK